MVIGTHLPTPLGAQGVTIPIFFRGWGGAVDLDRRILSAVRGAVSGGRRTEQWRAAIGGAHVNAPCAGAAQLGVP